MLPFFTFGSPTTCTYCGQYPNETDHVIAVSTQNPTGRSRKTSYGPTTYCCTECNVVLNKRRFNSFLERCRFVSERYNSQAKAVLWSKKEISQLDFKLRNHVEHKRNLRLWYRDRADWFESRDFLLGLSNLIHEPCLDKTNINYNEELYNYFYTTLCFANIYK